MNIKDRIIRLLGGIPWEQTVVPLNLCDRGGNVIINGYSDDIIEYLGGVLLPKPSEGQYLRGPATCKMPVRRRKMKDLLDTTETSPLRVNLCANCGATPEGCELSTKDTDKLGNTFNCDQWKPGVPAVKADRAGDNPSAAQSEPGRSL